MDEGERPIVGEAAVYAEAVKLFRARISALGITFDTVDALANFPSRYCATLLSGGKSMSIFSFFTMASALGLTVTFTHDEEKLSRLRSREDWITSRRTGSQFRAKRAGGVIRFNNHIDFYRQIGRKGAIARHARASAIRAMKRKAAMARWGKRFAAPCGKPRNGHALPK